MKFVTGRLRDLVITLLCSREYLISISFNKFLLRQSILLHKMILKAELLNRSQHSVIIDVEPGICLHRFKLIIPFRYRSMKLSR